MIRTLVCGINIILGLVLFISCRSNDSHLLNYDELFERFKVGKFLDNNTVLVDIYGNVLNHDTLKKCPPDFFFVYYYSNKNGEIVKAVLRASNERDKLFFKRVEDEILNPIYLGIDVKINCNDKSLILKRCLFRDQESRKSAGPIFEIDSRLLLM